MTQEQTQDNRGSVREDVLGPGISCFTTTSRGQVVEGVVRDISDTGAGISTRTEGLEVGEHIQIIFVVASGQKVRYRGFIKHVEYDTRLCGIQFTGSPETLDASYDPRATADAEANKDFLPKCRRCNTRVEIGYIIDHAHVGRGREMVCTPQWARGAPGRGVALPGGGPTLDAASYRVQTHRCPGCGLLESYAQVPQF